MLCLVIPRLLEDYQSSKEQSVTHALACPKAWQEHIVGVFEQAKTEKTDHLIFECNAYLETLKYMSVDTFMTEKIMRTLDDMVRQSLQEPIHSTEWRRFSLGAGLEALAKFHTTTAAYQEHTWAQLCSASKTFGAMPLYLEALNIYCETVDVRLLSPNLDDLVSALVNNLSTSSHTLRIASLRLFDTLHRRIHQKEADIIQTAITIENTPLDLQSARTASMHVRNLAALYKTVSADPWLSRAIPHFCFGLLTVKLSQLWDDSVDALRDICETKIGEETVSNISFRWLEISEPFHARDDPPEERDSQRKHLNQFQCSNLIHIEYSTDLRWREIKAASEHHAAQFQKKHCLAPLIVPEASSRALRVLKGIPRIAEKRSRRLVPIFLRWATDTANEEETSMADTLEESINSTNHADATSHYRLGRKDQKDMLDLFCCFSNPRVLYKSPEVFDALIVLLTNGDVEIQKAALKAIFTWKLEGVQPYQENLMNLLDDSRFREEISAFLRTGSQGIAIQNEHRPELMPVLLRLLYGKMIARSGTSSGKRGQGGKRKAVFEALSAFPKSDLEMFVRISLGPLVDLKPLRRTQDIDEAPLHHRLTARKYVGFVNMMRDMLETLGNKLAFVVQPLMNALVFCLITSSRELAIVVDGALTSATESSSVSLLKNVRQTGLQCLILLFQTCPSDDLQPHLQVIFAELISPRLERLPIETAQAVSGVLHLFSTWASSPDMATFLSGYDPRVVSTIIDCLDVPSAKDEVKLFVIESILKRLVSLAGGSESLAGADHKVIQSQIVFTQVLRPNLDTLLKRTGDLLRKSPSKELLTSAIQLVSMTAPIVTESSHTVNLLDVSTFLLSQPSHRVSPRSKGDLLQILQHFVPLIDLQRNEQLQEQMFNIISSLFGYFKDRNNRVILSEVLSVLARKDEDLKEVSELSISLNSFSTQKVEEPDFDKRLKAFSTINESKFRDFSQKQWRPLVYNMIFYVRDTEELAIRSNASFALRRFIEISQTPQAGPESARSDLLKNVLLPALRSGAAEPSELVRTEYLAIMAHLIRHNPAWRDVSDMYVLLANDDEEASFFANILHIQQHRRLRALRRLASEARQGQLGSGNVAHFLIPLIEHFIFDKADDDDSAHNLAAESIMTIGALADCLEWPQFRAMFRRFSSYIQSKPDIVKTTIKLIGVTIDALDRAAATKMRTATPDDGGDANNADDVLRISENKIRSTLATTLPKHEKLTDDLTKNLLPPLQSYLHNKDESTVSLRVPVAVSIVKLLNVLPQERLLERLPPVLTDVCHILRSRAQESRDLTRKTLVEMSTLIGPSCFGFVLSELRSSLARGYQLHVLSYTVHSILVATASIFKPGDLDYCLPQIVSIIMDDIFGATGQEKDAEEYISKMKEVKSSKSYDSMELIAKTASVTHFVDLIRPLQTLLNEKLDLTMVKKIDELLRRIGVGLLRNEATQSREMLVFCFEVIRDVYKASGASGRKPTKEDYRIKRFLVNVRGSKSGTGRGTSSYDYKLARFSLDVLRSVLHKYDILQTPANLSGFMSIIGDALLQAQEEVQISALRLLATIIKVPLRDIDDNAAVYISEAVKMIKDSTTTSTEIAQAALKLISAILRERRQVNVKENDLAFLLKRLKPDLEEPDRQGVTFNFLKAVMARKIIIPEMYEILDTVAAMMVTNQTRGARDLARGVYFQFIMDYPQGRDRLTKQLSFLVRNLDYKHLEGRQSVMEAIHLLLSKVGNDLVQQLVGTFFVPLLMVIINDEAAECRQMAGALLKELFERADNERTNNFLTLLRTWIGQDEQALLVRVALQSYCVYFEVDGTNREKEVPVLQARLVHLINTNLVSSRSADWELLYLALQTITKLCKLFPDIIFATNCAPLWAGVRQCLYFPHAWVKLAAAKLLGMYFADFARKNAENERPELPLKGSGGLRLADEEMVQITKASLGLLRVPSVSEELATQSVRNLIFLGRFMGNAATPLSSARQLPDTDVADVDEDSDNDASNEVSADSPTKTALQYIFERVSAILRREPTNTKAPSMIPKTAALQLTAALCSHLSAVALSPSMQTILLPLHNLTDPTIPAPYSSDEGFRTAYKASVSTSQEIMSLLQKKLGTTEYIAQLTEVREGVKERREGRRVKRRLEAVAEPEKLGREKKRKGEKKREKRKEKSGEERGRRRGW